MSWGMMAEQLRWSVMEDEGWRKGPWTAEEDRLLIEYVKLHGEGRWNSVARLAALKRNGKSCRLRWVNYLRPDLKRGQITPHEENIILELHARWGNRWSTIARSLPGRTDNEIKNYWRTHFKKKAKASPNTNGKAKVRLLRKQQLQQQQQQREQQINQMEINRIASLLDNENDNKLVSFLPETRAEIATPYQNSIEDQGFFYPLFNGCYAAAHMNEAPSHEDNNLWDGLWNLDDFHGNLGMACGANKVGLIHTSLATPFY